MEWLQLCTHIFLVLPSSTMEEVDELETNWLDGFGEELAKDLLDDTTSVLFVPNTVDDTPASAPSVSVLNKLISTVYSGPTISDIESALSLTFWGSIDNQSQSRPVISLPEKGIGKSESKYTVRMKSSGSALADDGYKWRKYGQKSIKNSPNPRSYYRCTNPRCNAKKQVEKSTEDPEMLIVTYEGLHLHYTYSHFLLPRPQDSPSAGLHVSKKPKIQTVISETPEAAEPKTHNTIITDEEEQRLQQVQKQSEKVGEGNTQGGLIMKDFVTEGLVDGIMLEEEQSPQGLLEDVVPWLVRKPYSTTTSSSEQSSSYSQSSPSYSSTFSWSPAYCYLDEAILSDLI